MENEDNTKRIDNISFGSAAKGVLLKCYVDFNNPDSVQKKLENMIKTREWLAKKGFQV